MSGPKEVKDELGKKRNLERNEHILKAIDDLKQQLEAGEIVSASLYVRSKDGTSTTVRSYSENPEGEAGALLAMALDRLSFTRA